MKGCRAGKGDAIFAVCPLESRCTLAGRARPSSYDSTASTQEERRGAGAGGVKILESKTEELNFHRRPYGPHSDALRSRCSRCARRRRLARVHRPSASVHAAHAYAWLATARSGVKTAILLFFLCLLLLDIGPPRDRGRKFTMKAPTIRLKILPKLTFLARIIRIPRDP